MDSFIIIILGILVIWFSLQFLSWLFKITMDIFGTIGAYIAAVIPTAITYIITYSILGHGMTKITLAGVISSVILGVLGMRKFND